MMTDYSVRLLDETTWPDFARLVESQNGVWGGCWCMGFHPEGFGPEPSAEKNKANKHRRVREKNAHAALVFDGMDCVGWCQFGPADELTRIKHRRAYDQEASTPPRWRITCFYVHKRYRRRGVASAALDGALREIANCGGGTVESYPEDAEGRKPSSSFLHNGTVAMFETRGFERTRRLGKHHWVVTRTIGGPVG